MKRPRKRLVILLCCLLAAAALYVTAAYSPLPFIARWRTAYISTALGTQRHQWLATALLPRDVVRQVADARQAALEAQTGLRSQWTRNASVPFPAAVTDQESFYALFPEIEPASMMAWLHRHPNALAAGWSGLTIDEAGLGDGGTEIRTVYGEQVLAVDVPNRLLLVRIEVSGCRGVLAFAKDSGRLSIQPSANIGVSGETAGAIAQAHNGVLAMTCSGFEDERGGILAGYARCGGKDYGDAHLPPGNKRLELRRDGLFQICDTGDPVSEDCTDAVEFHPALIVDGESVLDGGWPGFQPRVCIGQTDRYEILMLVMEGRVSGTLGAELEDCAQVLQRHGCMQAMNLDGGNSAILWYDGRPVTVCSDSSRPDGRLLPTAFVYARQQ